MHDPDQKSFHCVSKIQVVFFFCFFFIVSIEVKRDDFVREQLPFHCCYSLGCSTHPKSAFRDRRLNVGSVSPISHLASVRLTLSGPALHIRHLTSESPRLPLLWHGWYPANLKSERQKRIGRIIYPGAWVSFARWPYEIPKLGFKDLLAWIINVCSVYCECMFDYILQPGCRTDGFCFLEVVLGLTLIPRLVLTSGFVLLGSIDSCNKCAVSLTW